MASICLYGMTKVNSTCPALSVSHIYLSIHPSSPTSDSNGLETDPTASIPTIPTHLVPCRSSHLVGPESTGRSESLRVSEHLGI